MDGYSANVERQMVRFYGSLTERERRRHAALEASRLGHGGVEYISQLFGCDPKTMRFGMAELQAREELETQRQRKKGGMKTLDANLSTTRREFFEHPPRSHGR